MKQQEKAIKKAVNKLNKAIEALDKLQDDTVSKYLERDIWNIMLTKHKLQRKLPNKHVKVGYRPLFNSQSLAN